MAIDFDNLKHHPDLTELAEYLASKLHRTELSFFRLSGAFWMSLAAAQMRTNVVIEGGTPGNTFEREILPVNMFATNLAPSGYGKTYTNTILEDTVLAQFKAKFNEQVFPFMAQRHIPVIATKHAKTWGTDPEDEEKRLSREFDDMGGMLFTFSEATAPAIKQARQKLLLANAGALNLIVDELGQNFVKSDEALTLYLEMWDKGFSKEKLIKSSNDNRRGQTLEGSTPANYLGYGVPNALLDGAHIQEKFFNFLTVGAARRSMFAMVRRIEDVPMLSPEQVLANKKKGTAVQILKKMADKYGRLADIVHADQELIVPQDTELLHISYQQECRIRGNQFDEFEELRRAEMEHRHMKALKLAGAFAFYDCSPEVLTHHYEYAIALAEESGAAFSEILRIEQPHEKVARFIAAKAGRKLTEVDIKDKLPCFKGSAAQRNDILTLAIAWAYQNNIVIKQHFQDKIRFLSGEQLNETNLDELVVSHSDDIAHNYEADHAHWDQLDILAKTPGLHWANHHFTGGHRHDEKAVPGFNTIVLDIDNGVPMSSAQMLLQGHKAFFYTTKSHQVEKHGHVCDRYRIIIPTNYVMYLNSDEYKSMMKNIFEWLPFEVDSATGQRARKWESGGVNSICAYNDGELFDVLPFIEETKKNEDFRERLQEFDGFDSLERWMMMNTGSGNRNNMLLRYAMMLNDAGIEVTAIEDAVKSLNAKLDNPLSDAEILTTVMKTVQRKAAA